MPTMPLAHLRWPLAVFGLLSPLGVCGGTLRGEGPVQVVVDIPHHRRVQLSCRGTALRLQLVPAGGRTPLVSPMLAPSVEDVPCSKVETSTEQGVSTSAGSVTVDIYGVVRIYSGSGGARITNSTPIVSDSEMVLYQPRGRLLGGGSDSPGGMSLSTPSVSPIVGNTACYAPYYYSEMGYGVLSVVERADYNKYPASYELTSYGDSQRVNWLFTGMWDMYIMPAASLREGTRAYYELTGRPPVPPRYTFGFMASRWGWKDRTYIENVIQKFRDGKYPIDAIIMDFEWFTNETDYGYAPSEGKSYYKDFGFNPVTFPEPAYQLAEYAFNSNIRVAGIRKPRMGNSAVIEELEDKKWLLPHCEPAGRYPPVYPGYSCGRNVDFSIPEARDWYAKELQPLLNAGMSFWWNDEGETDYFTNHWWNVAQKKALETWSNNMALPQHRFFSLNRAFTPGLSRLGATVWTGDVTASWDWLLHTPGTMLNWVLAGAPYVSCDSGGFIDPTSAELLIRWLQVACFMPVMRVHSEINVDPHWPWLWGPVAADAYRKILNLRYRLLPYHYSLAHAQYDTGEMWIRPLLMDFPNSPEVHNVTTHWMDGSILVAPVLREDSTHDLHLPPGLWYRLDKALMLAEEVKTVAPGVPVQGHDPLVTQGSGTRVTSKVPMKEVPCFVRPGTILPLSPVVQHSGEIGQGPLQVYVFGGSDGHFTLVEDDGWSTKYQQGDIRSTNFKWADHDQTLSWTSMIPFEYTEHGFSQLSVYFVNIYGHITQSPILAFSNEGSFTFQAANEVFK